MDDRTSRGIAGNLNDHMKWKAAEAVGNGGGAGDAMGMGMGAAMGLQMAQGVMGGNAGGPWGQAPQAAQPAPPPPPVEHVWHIAENGKTTGPFSKARLGQMAAEGTLKRETYVWTAGQDGWKAAGDVQELAQLFTIMPPPPPPGA